MLALTVVIGGVQLKDLASRNERALVVPEQRINEVEAESKAENQKIRNEMIEANSTTKAQLSEIQVSVAIANTNIQYLVKQYDNDKGLKWKQ